MDSEQEFRKLASLAKINNLLSQYEIDLLCQKGTRKSQYWGRHLRNLKEYLRDKINKLPERTKSIDELLKLC